MQKYKISFKGQNIYVGIDVHLKTWHVTTLTETGCKYSFAQHSDAKELFDRLNRKFPDAHFKSAYEAGFCGFSAHYALMEQGFENIVVNAADIPTQGSLTAEEPSEAPALYAGRHLSGAFRQERDSLVTQLHEMAS